jgi:hypothetical protein
MGVYQMGSSDTLIDPDALDIKKLTRDELSRLRKELSDPMFCVILRTKPEEEQNKFRIKLREIETARLILDNAILGEIADKLKENAEELKKGAKAVDDALKDLEKTEDILEAIAAFLAIVANIVDVVA